MSSCQFAPLKTLGRHHRGLALGAIFCSVLFTQWTAAPSLHAAVSWDAQGNSQWWFDPVNWSDNMLPPNNAVGAATDAQINIGTGAWDQGEGVVYDPDNDPFYANALTLTYPAGYGPQSLYRLYISRNTPLENLLTIKSGNLSIESTTIIGRSGSTIGDPNEGRVVQKGGTVSFPTTTLDIGQRESSGWGNGVWDYQGGILAVQQTGGTQGIRLSAGSDTNGAGGTGRFIMHNPTSGGYVRTYDFTVAAENGAPAPGNVALDPDGITTGVGIVEFHYENGRTRPIQVDRNLSINNGRDDISTGTRSSRLDLKVNEPACVGTSCVPNNIGLFDVNFNNVFSGVINGTGDLDGDTIFNNDRVFSNVAGTLAYRQGDTVSASFGGVRYDWTISYTGEITWSDANNSVVSSVAETGGTDVVLIGLGSASVGLAGDFDNDGNVDGRDFLVWQRNTSVGSLGAWQANYGMPQVAVIGAVPEPGSLLLLSAAALSLIGLRRTSNQR